MCCNCKEKIVIICMAIWTLIQSMGYATLAILGILVHQCEMEMNSDKVSYLWYLIYFRRAACGDVDWSRLGLNIPNDLQPIWPDVTDVANRTYIIGIVYLSLSAAWMITSLGLIIGALTSCIGRCYFFSSLVLWSIIGILILLADCAGLGVFTYDLVHTTTFSDMLNFLQITNAQYLITAAGDFWAPFYLPSLLMMLIAARVFIIWGFNIAIIVLVIRFGSRIGRNIPKSVDNNHPRPTPYEYGRDANRDSPYAQGNDPNRMYAMRAQPNGVVQRHSVNSNNNNRNTNNGYNGNESIPRVVPVSHGPQSKYPQNGAYDNPTYPSKNSSLPPQSNDIGWAPSAIRQSKIPPETPPKPILKSRNTQIDQISTDNSSDRSDRNSLQVPPDELRSQLPWSYTSNPEELSKPKRTFVALRDDEDLPPVPVPDYTLHFPKNKRSGIDNTDYR